LKSSQTRSFEGSLTRIGKLRLVGQLRKTLRTYKLVLYSTADVNETHASSRGVRGAGATNFPLSDLTFSPTVNSKAATFPFCSSTSFHCSSRYVQKASFASCHLRLITVVSLCESYPSDRFVGAVWASLRWSSKEIPSKTFCRARVHFSYDLIDISTTTTAN
jgi:hypothetical protein